MLRTAEFRFFSARNGQASCEVQDTEGSFLLHSRYDPGREADRWAASQLETGGGFDSAVVYGLGCGHHLRSLLRLTERADGPRVGVEVWEFNAAFYQEAFKQCDFSDLLENPRLSIRLLSGLEDIQVSMIQAAERLSPIFLHEPSVRVIPDSYQIVRELLQDYRVRANAIRAAKPALEQHFILNSSLGSRGIRGFAGKFKGVPAILVAAGPSLDRNRQQLRDAGKHALLAAVGTSLKPLLLNGIVPDLVMLTDVKDAVCSQIEGIEAASLANLPLFYLSTANHNAVAAYPGPKFRVCQQGVPEAEREAGLAGEPVIETGGSVAAALLDLLACFGCSPIAAVGLDLSLSEGRTHAGDTHLAQQYSEVRVGLEIENYHRTGTVKTLGNLYAYLTWFQRYARDAAVELYNCTEGGAYIEGFQHIGLREFIARIRDSDGGQARAAWRACVDGIEEGGAHGI